jgi:hypothetical protein
LPAKFPIALVAFCFKPDVNDDDDDELSDDDDELLLDVLLLLFPVSIPVALSLSDDRSTAKAVCFNVMLTKDAVKINANAKLAKTKVLFIFYSFLIVQQSI